MWELVWLSYYLYHDWFHIRLRHENASTRIYHIEQHDNSIELFYHVPGHGSLRHETELLRKCQLKHNHIELDVRLVYLRSWVVQEWKQYIKQLTHQSILHQTRSLSIKIAFIHCPNERLNHVTVITYVNVTSRKKDFQHTYVHMLLKHESPILRTCHIKRHYFGKEELLLDLHSCFVETWNWINTQLSH